MHEIFKDEFVKLGGALYRGHFAANYAKLGREVVYMKNGEWRDTAVSLEAEREFSKRHEQIAKAKGKGRNDKAAWETTRSAKDPGADINQIKKDWKQRFERLKTKTHKQNAEESIQARTDWATAAEFNEEAVQERQGMRGTADEVVKWQLAARRATDKTATASPQALATEYINERLREGAGPPVTYKEALIRLERQVKAGNLVKIEDRYTSWEMIAAEREYMDYAGTRLNQAAISAEAAGTFLAGYQLKAKKQGKKVLSDIQQTAVKQMIATNKTLSVVQGDAGAGKTTALHAAADYYQTRGVKVIGLAMQGAAAKNLEAETGIESVTLSSFLRRKTHEESRILIFDEASMLDSRNAAKLFKIAERNRDKIILVGDRNQLQSIGAGRVFERLVADCESAGDLISLNENFRQRNDALKKAVDLAKQGRMKDSLAALDSRGDITEIESTPARRSAIAGLYNKDTLIIAGTTAAKDELNSMIRARLAAAGALKQGVIYKLGRADKDGIEHERELTISKGEIITFTRNEYKNYDIRNGERAKVLECGEKSIIVETEDKRRLEINIEKYKGIDYGYALTTYKAQGQTYNSVVVESDTHIPTLVDMRNQYVNITRARDNVKIYTDDKEQLQELAEIRTYSRDTISCEHTFKAKERLAELDNRARRGNTVEQIVAYNEAAVASTKDFLKSVPGDKWATEDLKKYETAMAQATQRLNELELSEEKKRAIADVLNNQKNAYIWNRPDMTTADEKIAAAQTYLKPKKENTSHHDSGRSFEREI
jgi:hypothetical protein